MQLMIDSNEYFHRFVEELAWIENLITSSVTSNRVLIGMKYY